MNDFMKKSFKATNHINKKNEHGLVLILLLLLLPFFIGLAMLVLDLGRMFVAIREAQNLADVIANTGSYLLLKDVSYDQKLEDWQDIKPSAKALAIQIPILGAAPVAASDYFTAGTSTVRDKSQYGFDTLNTTPTDNAYGLSIKVERGIQCYDDDGTMHRLSLDNQDELFCLANYVQAEVSLKNMSIFFGKFFGFQQFAEVKRYTVAHVRPQPDPCDQPKCSAYEPWFIVSEPIPGGPKVFEIDSEYVGAGPVHCEP